MPIPAERALPLLYNHVKTLFVAADNAAVKSLFMIKSVLMTSEQAARHSGALNHVAVAQSRAASMHSVFIIFSSLKDAEMVAGAELIL